MWRWEIEMFNLMFLMLYGLCNGCIMTLRFKLKIRIERWLKMHLFCFYVLDWLNQSIYVYIYITNWDE